MGLAETDIVDGMRQYRGVPGRLEAVRAGQPFQVFVDGARTPEALRVALHTLKRVCAGRLHLLLGHPGGEPAAARHELGRLAAHVADTTVVTSDNPGSESAAAIAAALAAGYGTRRCDGLEIVLDRDRALRRILSSARPGDCVLVAGKGHVAVQQLADTSVPFDDRDRARVILESLGYIRE
jgi:UDP-N-acetylmuramoyl-L-alanyl-D-glutamate--2,6-diaminopimelate ligase